MTAAILVFSVITAGFGAAQSGVDFVKALKATNNHTTGVMYRHVIKPTYHHVVKPVEKSVKKEVTGD